MDVGILVSEKYYKNPYEDDLLLRESLEKKGYKCQIIRWDNNDINYKEIKLVIIRSCWDYQNRVDEFLEKMKKISRETLLLNPYSLVLENSDKKYLKKLKEKNIPIVETTFIDRNFDLKKLNIRGKKVVIKPTISASGKDTYLCDKENIGQIREVINKIPEGKLLMIQPYMDSIEEKGERSTVIIDGKAVFTMKKTPEKGNFLVHKHFGGTYTPLEINKAEKEFVYKVWSNLDEKPLYARVDYLYDGSDRLLLLELELIEPNLYLSQNKDGLDLLVDRIILKIKERE